MKYIVMVVLLLIIALLDIDRRQLKIELSRYSRYKTNITRKEMILLLEKAANNQQVAVFIPGDTSISPYLIKIPD